MKTSEQINEISAALAKAQGEIKNPEKNRTAKYPTKAGGYVEYNYSDLPACFDAARDALSKNGLCHVATTEFIGEHYTLVCRLIHSSGQWYESEWPLPGSGADPKVVGAAITYGTRYLFNSMTGLAADEDMDEAPHPGGEYAARKPPVAPQAPTTPQVRHPSPAQLKRLFAIASSTKTPDEAIKHYCKIEFGIESSKDLTLPQYDQLVRAIETGSVMGEPGASG